MPNLRSVLPLILVGLGLAAIPAPAQERPPILEAVLGETGQKTAEISTAELRRLLGAGSIVLLDARPRREFAAGHIPGALNVAPKPGVPMSLYVSDVAEIDRLTGGRKGAPLVLYCNGPFCGKSKRLAEELLKAGHRDVRRYQLGIPVWRALGGVTVIEPEALGHLLANDRTLVVVDAREPDLFRSGSLPGARNLPRSGVLEGKDVGEVRRAKDDGRLPMEDHNTRIVVVAKDGKDARYVAEALAREAFHNVSYLDGEFRDAKSVSP